MSSAVSMDPEILGGVPVFIGTRVAVRSLFDYLSSNYTLDEFLECFPTVSLEVAKQVLLESQQMVVGTIHP